ncbi:hypothetical protein [Pseudonocardia spinosispora]|uniref:hypothetical protein n=1 Tax=Pseudonocardia spinosispora TaxID=103441 RepID=UPI0004253340|nr:hypothetical protein [Pseudonocardia spinosispora]
MTDRHWRLTLRGLGATFILLAAWAAIHPYSFTVVLANFGSGEVEPGTDHLVRDFAACAATFGAGLLLADRFSAWRSPALALTALWNGLHAIGHVVDIGKSHPAFVGPVEAVLLIVITALFARLTQLSIRTDHQGVRQ